MNRIIRMLGTALPLVLLLGAMPVSSDTALQGPVVESTSSGLFTFSREERAIRVAAVFAAKDSAVVPTLVKFLDQGGNVLKQVRGDLSEDNAVVAELTRDDVAGRGDLLVRVEVLHKLPAVRREPYSIIVSTQPISPSGSGSPGCSGPVERAVSFQEVNLLLQPFGQPVTQVMCNPPAFGELLKSGIPWADRAPNQRRSAHSSSR